MPKKQHIVVLSETERLELQDTGCKGVWQARVIRRAQMVLWSDQGKTDEEIADRQGIKPLTVAKTRQRWAEVIHIV